MAQIHVDNIVLRSTSETKSWEFVNLMQSKYEMNMVGELNYFLGLQVKYVDAGIFILQPKYGKNLIKKFSFENTKAVRTPRPHP